MKIGRAAYKKYEMEQKIYQAGMSLFQEKGFTNTTLEEISKKAEVSKGTIFNYFSSKEDILAKFGKDSLKKLNVFAEKLPESMSTRDKIVAVLLEDIRGVKDSEVYARITLKGIAEGGDIVYQLETKNRHNLARIYENILRAGTLSTSNLNLSLISDLIVSIYFHVLDKHFHSSQSITEIETYIIESLDILFYGIEKHLN
ncbi:TetR/AcrR family transcriptional regulator [Bacillus sp. B15-48]|uniref:TetR/AcrR family transcriptional regulator n=1 Tax=Bacillus sp. B15-48 TaxID=1548601 RepID=UPI0019401CE2|nr:TetR/AcrR family transcriptional regulator [Bacillus sp. B15-48]MBM4764648.1 TetR family transcriptional regulator [Bacillus sp. B15-48]